MKTEQLLLYGTVALVAYNYLRGNGVLFAFPQPTPVAAYTDPTGGFIMWDNVAAIESVLRVRESGQAGGFI